MARNVSRLTSVPVAIATALRRGLGGFLLVVIGLPIGAHGEEILPDKFQIQVGSFFVTNVNTNVELAAQAGPITAGTRISFEDDLGLSSSDSVPRIDGYYRFGKRSRMDFTWFKIDRSGTAVTPFDIEFGDITIPEGTAVTSFFNEEVLKATYGLSFYNAPKAELGLSAGLFVARLGTGINAPANAEEAKGTAPLPVVGAYFRYNMARRWRLVGKGDFFYLQVGDYRGNLVDLRLNVEHQTWKHVGFGFGLDVIGTFLEADDGEFRGNFDNSLAGLQAYVFTNFGRAAYQK
jgi:hypothetical protein